MLLSLFPFLAFAQDAGPPTQVEGVVFDRITGQGVPGVKVMFWTPPSGPPFVSVTDFSGAFHVEIPQPGTYHVVADKPGLFVLSPRIFGSTPCYRLARRRSNCAMRWTLAGTPRPCRRPHRLSLERRWKARWSTVSPEQPYPELP